MKSVWNFLVKPVEERYDNSIKVKDKELVLNTSIEQFKFISNKAVVVNTPTAFSTVIEEGDICRAPAGALQISLQKSC